MKHHLIALALFGASSAFAATDVDRMVAQCHAVMICEACKVTNAPAPAGATVAVFIKGKIIRVPAAAMERLRAPGYAKDANGEYTMCNMVREDMKQPDSDYGLAARVSFTPDYDGREYCPPPKQSPVADLFRPYHGSIDFLATLPM